LAEDPADASNLPDIPSVTTNVTTIIVTQRLIYRLACLGFEDAMQAYDRGEPAMLAECSEHRIRVMLSKWLHPKLRTPRENMETRGIQNAKIERLQAELKRRESEIETLEAALALLQPTPTKINGNGDHVDIGDLRLRIEPSGEEKK
jgi:hypothetical protein